MAEEEVYEGTDFDPDVDAITEIDAYLEGYKPIPGDPEGDEQGDGDSELTE